MSAMWLVLSVGKGRSLGPRGPALPLPLPLPLPAPPPPRRPALINASQRVRLQPCPRLDTGLEGGTLAEPCCRQSDWSFPFKEEVRHEKLASL